MGGKTLKRTRRRN